MLKICEIVVLIIKDNKLIVEDDKITSLEIIKVGEIPLGKQI
jgi:hypothetical protein